MATGRLCSSPDDFDYLIPDPDQIDVEPLQGTGSNALTFVEKTEKDVLGADVTVVEETCFLLGENDYPSCPVGKALKHSWLLLTAVYLARYGDYIGRASQHLVTNVPTIRADQSPPSSGSRHFITL
jgi:hypothetical protein